MVGLNVKILIPLPALEMSKKTQTVTPVPTCRDYRESSAQILQISGFPIEAFGNDMALFTFLSTPFGWGLSLMGVVFQQPNG
jgi:hypothetical protein